MRPRTRFQLNDRVPVLTAGRQEGTTLTTGGGRKVGPGPSLRMCRDPIGTSLRSWLEPFVIARDYVLPDSGQTAIDPEPQMTNKVHFPPDALAAILDQAPGLRDYPIRLPDIDLANQAALEIRLQPLKLLVPVDWLRCRGAAVTDAASSPASFGSGRCIQ